MTPPSLEDALDLIRIDQTTLAAATRDEHLKGRVYTVTDDSGDIIGIFWDERTAARFRLAEVNRLVNG